MSDNNLNDKNWVAVELEQAEKRIAADDRRQDNVNHPSHYTHGGAAYEAILVIEAWRLGFCTGNAVKYIARAGRKDASKEAEDIAKAIWYLQRHLATLKAKETK